jgi:hypothetical protein
MMAGKVPSSLWEEACVWAIDTHNCRAVAGLVPHVQLFGSWPDLTPLAPFYSFIVAFNNNNMAGRFKSRSLLSRYIGPARQHGIGAIRVQIERTVRVVRTWRYIAAPGDDVDPTTLRVTSPQTPRSTEAISRHDQSRNDDADSTLNAPTTIETPSVRPAPTREQVYAAAGRADAAVTPSDNPDDDEPRRSWYISRPWTIPIEFRPRNVTWPEPYGHHLPEQCTASVKTTSRLETAIIDKAPTPAPRLQRQRTKVVRFDPGSEAASRWGVALVAAIVGPGNEASTTSSPSSSDGGALAPELRSLHEASHDTTPAPLGAMSLRTVLRRPDALKWVEAFGKERLDLASTFADGKPALFRVHRSEVSNDAIVLNSLVTNCVNRAGKQKSRWVVDGSRRPGEKRDAGASSPTCLASSVLLVFSAAAQNKWHVAQFDVVKAYMLAVPSHLYYVRYPPGFDEYLARSEDAEQFNTNAFLLRVDKNCYGAADAGRMWYDTLQGFLKETLGFKTSQIDRCVFVRHEYKGNQWTICVILVYVDDLLVFGSISTVTEVSAALRARFPLTDGASDYLGIEFEISDNAVHVHQEAYVVKVVEEAGFGGCRPVTTPLTTDYTAADFDAPAGADSNAANTIDFPHVNGQLGYLATHTMPWLLYAFGIFSSTSRPSVAIPDAPMPGHRAALARTMRYIKGAARHGLLYTRQRKGFTLTGYCDASHGREMHRTASGFCKSRSGGCIVASGASIHAFSQAQQSTALSTFESELTALVLLVKNLLALRRLGAFVLDASLPTSVVYCDNMSVIMQLHKRDLSARTRHVRTNLGFVYDAIDDGDIIVTHIRTMENPANTFTAAENRDRFRASVTNLSGHAA